MKSHSFRRTASGLLSGLLLSTSLPLAALADGTDTVERYSHSFNGLGDETGFTDSHNLGMSCNRPDAGV